MVNNYRYKISVIMPLFNVADYLEEAIDSITAQTIGFEENIQLILVNDGSTDNVGAICKKYEKRYPNNVIYIEQPNKGVSAARNKGIEFVQGKYINFFDGDDAWDSNAFSVMYAFFEKNFDRIDFVAGRYCFFGAKEGFSHPLDFKFNATRIVDIDEEYNCIQLSAATTLIKASVMKKFKFDVRLKFSEDSVLLTEILLNKKAYGVVREAVYYYRKRGDKSSAIDVTTKSPEWYFDTPQYCLKKLFDISQDKYGIVIPYIQFQVMYDLQWRLVSPYPEFLSDEEKNEYKSNIVMLLKNIDDTIIAEQKNLNFAYKIFALSLKHNKNIVESMHLDRWKVYYNGVYLFSLRNQYRLIITNMQIRRDTLFIEGTSQTHILGKEWNLKIQASDRREIPIEFYTVRQRDIYGFTGDKIFEGRGFRVAIPLGGLKWIRFYLQKGNESPVILNPSFGRFAKLDKTQKNSYYAHGGFLLKYGDKKIKVIKKNKKRLILAELRYLRDTVLSNHNFKLALLRIISYVSRFFCKKPIWIVSDRTDMARDNGEALFTYLINQNRTKKRKIYFVLDKKSVDFSRIKKIGTVLKLDSLRYKLCFLQAEKIISAHADDWVINAFGENRNMMRNLYDFDYVFLQHGIIKDDLSQWLHKFNKGINLFITAVKDEYESIVEGDYGYTEKEVKLTGLPRYDKLVSNPKKQIVILPTWRKDIANPTIKGTSLRAYSDTFKDTEYFKFYNSLINDKRLLHTMEQHGYCGEFYVHPAFFSQINDFTGNHIIKVVNEEADYQKIFRENTLMITDFSSVAFDFAYMKKPVIYSQFDYNSFFHGHTYEKGYFDYEEDGFGPVCYTYDDTVNSMIKCIEQNCVLESVYEKRIDDFFAWKDQNNCERVYQAIQDMDRV